MDRIRNPFAPGAGNPPPELAGRAPVLDDVTVALKRLAIGRPTQSSILVGLRGVGKTVLLVRIGDIAEAEGFKVHSVEAHEGKGLPELLTPGLRSILISLSMVEGGESAEVNPEKLDGVATENTQYYRRRGRRVYRRYYRRPARRYYRRARRYYY